MNKLTFGQTPWDNMNKDLLLREVQKMYAAIVSAYSCIKMERTRTQGIKDTYTGYWGKGGTGGTTLEQLRQIVIPLEKEYGSQIYDMFHRYAVDLLFDCSEYNIGFGWVVCPNCGNCYGTSTDGKSLLGKKCNSIHPNGCDENFVALEWKHLTPNWGNDNYYEK